MSLGNGNITATPRIRVIRKRPSLKCPGCKLGVKTARRYLYCKKCFAGVSNSELDAMKKDRKSLRLILPGTHLISGGRKQNAESN